MWPRDHTDAYDLTNHYRSHPWRHGRHGSLCQRIHPYLYCQRGASSSTLCRGGLVHRGRGRDAPTHWRQSCRHTTRSTTNISTDVIPTNRRICTTPEAFIVAECATHVGSERWPHSVQRYSPIPITKPVNPLNLMRRITTYGRPPDTTRPPTRRGRRT